jgi:hypothetical protein
MAKDGDPTRELTRAVARLHAGILALVVGAFCGFGLFVATAVLVIEAGLNTGATLGRLRYYFPGYTVTWPGAFIGLLYGCVFGAIVGWSIGLIYNRIVGFRGRSRGG